MPQSRELDPFDMWQDLLQGVKGNFQVSRTLAAAEQKHFGLQSPEAFQLPTHLDDYLKVILECRSKLPHRQVLATAFFVLAFHHHVRECLEREARQGAEDR